MSEELASTSLKRSLSIDDKDTCSLQDVLDSEKERNEIACAVLGGSDSTTCSYDKGYVFRQAIYCCVTCSKANDEPHGICLACSYECHQNHELDELYTKRHFRCDCGNDKFKKSKLTCKLRPNKDDINSLNNYNHNFNGLYCTCNKPYPETSANNSANKDEENEDMIQCSVCEDWFHLNHLKGNECFPTNEDDYDEMICQSCMSKNKFLWYYQGYMALKSDSKGDKTENDESKNVDILSVDDNKGILKESNENIQNTNNNDNECSLNKLKTKQEYLELNEETINRASCFKNNWRDFLCKCLDCLNMYKENNIEFLTKSNDTIKYYEDYGKQKEAENQQIDENKLLNDELSKLDRVSQVEFLHNVNDFKQELTEFLSGFAQNGQVVSEKSKILITKFALDIYFS
jgi:E3 ubiquitin-protein ligase UBR7